MEGDAAAGRLEAVDEGVVGGLLDGDDPPLDIVARRAAAGAVGGKGVEVGVGVGERGAVPYGVAALGGGRGGGRADVGRAVAGGGRLSVAAGG